jgi:hypothetical protein
MKRLLASVSVVALGAAAFLTTRALAGDAPAAPAAASIPLGNSICPVTGQAVTPGHAVIWGGVEIGLCCPKCPPLFVAHPEAYAPALLKDMATQVATLKARLAAAGLSTATSAAPAGPPVQRPPAPAMTLPIELGNPMCPVMNRPVRPGLFVEYHGMKVGLCCGGCDAKLRADPARYLDVLRQDPAMARRIDAAEAAWAASQPR